MLKKINLIVLVFLSVLLSFSFSEAGWWNNKELSEKMKLTDKNTVSFDKIISENRQELLQLQKKIKQLNADLSKTLKDKKISKKDKLAQINETAKKIAALRSDITLKNYSSKTKVLSALTGEQLSILIEKYPNIIQRRWRSKEAGSRQGKRQKQRHLKLKEKSSAEKPAGKNK